MLWRHNRELLGLRLLFWLLLWLLVWLLLWWRKWERDWGRGLLRSWDSRLRTRGQRGRAEVEECERFDGEALGVLPVPLRECLRCWLGWAGQELWRGRRSHKRV